MTLFKSKSGKSARLSSGRVRSWLKILFEGFFGFLISAIFVGLLGLVLVLWGWSQRDHFLTAELQNVLSQKFPEAIVALESAEFDSRGRVIVSNLRISSRSNNRMILSVPALRVTLDQELLTHQRQVDITSLDFNQPELTLTRTADGGWNVQDLVGEGSDKVSLPIIRIRDATVMMQWEHEQFSRAVRVQLDAVDADLIPSSSHQFQFAGSGREERLGTSQFEGSFDLLHHTWDFSGDLKRLRIDQPLLEVASQISPDAETVVSQLQMPIRKPQHAGTTPTITAEAGPTTENTLVEARPVNATTDEATDTAVSLELTTDLQFHTSRAVNEQPEFSLFAELVDGRMHHPELPVPLDQIRGSLAVDRRGIRIDDVVLGSGQTTARITGAWGWSQSSLPDHVDEGFQLSLTQYRVTPTTREFLPHDVQNLYDELQPSGIINGEFLLKRKQAGGVDFSLNSLSVQAGRIRHVMFAYPVDQVQGTITRTDQGQGPETWKLDFQGMAANRPVSFQGQLKNPGRDYKLQAEIQTSQFPIDEQFYRALKPQHRSGLAYVGLLGTGDVKCQLSRDPVTARQPKIALDIQVYDSSIRIRDFPLTIRDVSATLSYDERGWEIPVVRGRHGQTPVQAKGYVWETAEGLKVDLNLNATDGLFDHELYLAISHASSDVANAWDLLRPRGKFDLNCNVSWQTGQLVAVQIPSMKVKNCEINPTVLPWRLTNLNSTVSVTSRGVVAFENLTASHDQTRVETSGSFAPREGYWQLRFDRLIVDDLSPNHELLAALPDHSRTLLKTIQLRDPVSLSGQAEFKGDYAGKTVTSAFDTQLVLNQADLFLGVEVNDVSGTVSLQGRTNRDGLTVIPHGKLSIDSCWVLGYHVTDVYGPFEVKEDRMIIGSPKMFESEDAGDEWTTVIPEERVTGRIFGGELFLDMLVQRTPSMPYLLRCTLSGASLEQWAIESNYGQADIKGEMNGYIDLAGDSVSSRATIGNGRLLISPASLYELPVLFQMFQSLRFAPIDNTAFRHAYAEFRVLDEKFVFDEIGLLGDSMSLFGQGYIRFDRTIDLDFVYRPPRRTNINFASQLISRLEGVLPILFTVEVDGTLDVPQISVKDGVRETLRGFRRLLEQTPGNIRPPKSLPTDRIRIPILSNQNTTSGMTSPN